MQNCISQMSVGPISGKTICMRLYGIIKTGKDALEKPANNWQKHKGILSCEIGMKSA